MYHGRRFHQIAHKSCVIAKEVEIIRDPSHGPSIVTVVPETEETLHIPDSGEPIKIRADIKFSEIPGSTPQYVDVTVADASAPSYRTLYHSDSIAAAVSGNRELDKWRKYHHVLPSLHNWHDFHGFGVEASGRVGPGAENLLQSLNPDQDEWRQAWMLRTINVLIMKWNARKILASLPYFQLPINDPIVPATLV